MRTVGFFKRLLIMIYDGLLLFSLVFLSSALIAAIFKFVLAPDALMQATSIGAAPTLNPTGKLIGSVLVAINSIAVSIFYFGWFWTHGGQTPGMKAWSLYLVKPDGKFVDWPLAIKRCIFAALSWAALGLGFTWILLNRRRRAWHDILSNTQIVHHKPSTK